MRGTFLQKSPPHMLIKFMPKNKKELCDGGSKPPPYNIKIPFCLWLCQKASRPDCLLVAVYAHISVKELLYTALGA